MREENINGHAYRIGTLDAKRQFHVVRRLAPVLAASGTAARAWLARNPVDQQASQATPAVGLADLFDAFGPLAEAVGGLSDDNTDYVLNTCLAVCQRNTGTAWAAVATRDGHLMFADLSMVEMLRLTMAVLQENLSGFLGEIGGPLSDASGPAA